MQPYEVTYPTTIDTDAVLVDVKDSLILKLAIDYNPGDVFIRPDATLQEIDQFPPRGFITLTDNRCQNENRAVSFYYTYIDTTRIAFAGLTVLPSTTDTYKPAVYTTITLNVIAEHHNVLKNSSIAIEQFLGIDTEVAAVDINNATITERANRILEIAYNPVAWFEANVNVIKVPNKVIFTNQTTGLGVNLKDNNITLEWDFGDNDYKVDPFDYPKIYVDEIVPPNARNVIVVQTYPNINKVIKTYNNPGLYSVTLRATNKYGSSTITLPEIVNARIEAPNFAQICVTGLQTIGNAPQVVINNLFRTPTNAQLSLEVPTGIAPTTTPAPGEPPAQEYTYAGELVVDNQIVDPITTWSWYLSDDNPHGNAQQTYANYTTGGIYSIILRVDTEFNCYRITNILPPTFPDCSILPISNYATDCGAIPQEIYGIDVIERTNLFLWLYTDSLKTTVRATEYGLISQTFKCPQVSQLTLNQDSSFLIGLDNYENQLYEFETNFGIAYKSGTYSGLGSLMVMFWASGRTPLQSPTAENVLVSTYSAYTTSYVSKAPFSRTWNWMEIQYNDRAYFFLGTNPPYYPDAGGVPSTSDTNMNLTVYNIATETAYISQVFNPSSFFGAASELQQNPFSYSVDGNTHGNFAKYRLAVHQNIGYFLRDSIVGSSEYILRNFYCTVGTPTNFISGFRKLPDMSGPARSEGRLVNLSDGLYFFNNSVNISVFKPATQVWSTGYAVSSNVSFRSLQDTSITNFDNPKNTLLASSDNDHLAYISFSYSQAATMKFNNTTLTFSSMAARPSYYSVDNVNPIQTGSQWTMGIF